MHTSDIGWVSIKHGSGHGFILVLVALLQVALKLWEEEEEEESCLLTCHENSADNVNNNNNNRINSNNN